MRALCVCDRTAMVAEWSRRMSSDQRSRGHREEEKDIESVWCKGQPTPGSIRDSINKQSNTIDKKPNQRHTNSDKI